MNRWARQATSKWKYKYEGRGKWCLPLMQMELGPHARSAWVHSLGHWWDHTCKQIQTGLSCGRGLCMLAVQSDTNTYPFSWPMLRQSGINWFYGGIGKQEPASQPLAGCLDIQESSVREEGGTKSHISPPERNCLSSTLNSQRKCPGGTALPIPDLGMSKRKTGMASNPSGYIWPPSPEKLYWTLQIFLKTFCH